MERGDSGVGEQDGSTERLNAEFGDSIGGTEVPTFTQDGSTERLNAELGNSIGGTEAPTFTQDGSTERLNAEFGDSIGGTEVPTFALTAGVAGHLRALIAAAGTLPASSGPAQALRDFELYEEAQRAERGGRP